MNRHDDRAASQCCQRADHERPPVARPHAHPLPRAHAQPIKLDPQRFNLAPERPVIQCPAGINNRDAVRPIPGGMRKVFENVHCSKNYFVFQFGQSGRRPPAFIDPNLHQTGVAAFGRKPHLIFLGAIPFIS